MATDRQNKNISDPQQASLGTFGGVFTPSILTILGIILFLRLGYVVGNAGLGRALIIIGLANAISVLTSISLSAIATNLRVKVGGPYYIISRTLGPEFGGAIGIVLFLAQSISIAFYCIGFGEALAAILPQKPYSSPQVIAAFAVAFLFVFAWLGADWGTRFQYVVMALLAAALFSFFAGGLPKWNSDLLLQNWVTPKDGPAFWILFAIFFPAVTGFTQGLSMSGDLKNPDRSLVLGTLTAVGISIVIYFGVTVVFAAAISGDVLRSDYSAMKRVSLFEFLVDAGVIAATLSSAMASLLGAPRILQSMASDRIFPFLLAFAKGSGQTNNPRRGTIFSAAIAFITIGLGNLNMIAPVVSMFFLVSYGLLNYATYYEAKSLSPSFRPRFRWFDLRISLLGFLACLGVMFAIDVTAGAVAVSLLFGIYQYLRRTAGPARWADSSRSHHLQQVRENLLLAAAEPKHPRDWRPQVLAFSNDSHRRRQLLHFASWIQGGSGLTTTVRILEGEGVKMLKLREEAEAELRSDIAQEKLPVFPLAMFATRIEVGVHGLIQTFGIGPLKANTILLNWVEHLQNGILGLRETRFGRNLRTAFRLGCNIIVLDPKKEEWATLESLSSKDRRIDVWWWNDATSHLMLLIAYLMTRDKKWQESKIRLLAGCYEDASEETLEDLRNTLDEVRIPAEPEVILNADADEICLHSEDASLVFLPFRFMGSQLIDPFGNPVEEILPRLPIVALVLAAEDIGLDAEPEEGEPGEIAAAMDAMNYAEKRAKEAEKEAHEAHEAAMKAEETLGEITAAAKPGADKEIMEKIEKAVEKTEHAKLQAERAKRRAAKAKAKAEDAAREAESIVPGAGDKTDED